MDLKNNLLGFIYVRIMYDTSLPNVGKSMQIV